MDRLRRGLLLMHRAPPRRTIFDALHHGDVFRSGDGVEFYFTAGELRPVPDRRSVRDPRSDAMRSLLADPHPGAEGRTTQIPNGSRSSTSASTTGTRPRSKSRGDSPGVSRASPPSWSPNQEGGARRATRPGDVDVVQFDDVERTRLVSGGVPVGGARGRDAAQAGAEGAAAQARAAAARGNSIGERQIAAGAARRNQQGTGRRAPSTGFDGYRTRQAVTAFQACRGCSGTASPAWTRAARHRDFALE